MSEPGGAAVVISTDQTCTTPCTFSMKRGHDLRVDCERDVIGAVAKHNAAVGEDVREGIADQGLIERPRKGG